MNRAQARALGLKRYTDGRVCPKGHAVERFVSTGSCVECLRAQNAAWREANPEKNRTSQRLSHRKIYWSNPELARENKLKSARKNSAAEKARFQRWYKANAHRVIAAAKAWGEANPERKRAHSRSTAATRRAKVAQTGGSFSPADVERMFVEQRGECVYCETFLNDEFEVDHKMPIALGGSNFPENLQLLCRRCNRKKSAKHPDVFAKEMRLLA